MSVWREVQEAIYQRWRTGWEAFGDFPPYALGNEGFKPPDGQWCRVTVKRLPGGAGTMGKAGNRKMDRRGVLYVQLFEPPGNGVGDLSDLAERAAKLFEDCRMQPHDIRFATVEPAGAEGEADVDKGRWWGVLVEGAFDYEELI